MLLVDFLTQATRITYLLIASITLAEFLRRRDRTRLDVALMFLSLAITVALQEVAEITEPPAWARTLTSIAVTAQPYLLIRLVTHFRPVRQRIVWLALAGMLLSWAILLVEAQPLPPWAIVVIVAYFVLAEGYAAVAFIRGAQVTGGVSRARHILAATGSALLAAVILLAGVVNLAPAVAFYTQPITPVMSLLSGLAYYFAFAPPRWLRHNWQFGELYRFLAELAGKPAEVRAAYAMPFLCDTALRATGGRAAVIGVWDSARKIFNIRATTDSRYAGDSWELIEGPIASAWRDGRAGYVERPSQFSPLGRRLAAAVEAESLFAVPVGTAEARRGVLVVLLQRSPLFPDDDLALLTLFGEQTALVLEQWELLVEQRQLVEHLQQRTAQLEAANKELEAFSYSVSHDLRAPLRHIEGFTDLLLRDPASTPHRQYLNRIADAATRMGRLIDDLLAFSRMGRAQLKLRPVALERLVDEARRELQAETEQRQIIWKTQPLPEVVADPDLLRQVFVNLLSNAIKYSRGRTPACIEVGTEPGDPGEVVVYVRDNGVGFDMRYADKLFGVFQRLHHSDEFEGVGIGLANVRRIIHRHGGRTWAHAAVGQGATFYVSLPHSPRSVMPQPLDGEVAGQWPDGSSQSPDEREA